MDELERRQKLGFLAAEGLQLPQQLKGHDVTRRVRIDLMGVILTSIEDHGDDYDHLGTLWTEFFEEFGDDFPDYERDMRIYLRKQIETLSGAEILALIEALCRQDFCTDDYFEDLQVTLEREPIAYRLVGAVGDDANPPTLFPVSTNDQAQRLSADYLRLGEAGGAASQKHLRAAASAISSGNYKASIRESIHAVESAAKIASGKSAATLPDALKALESRRPLHPALRKALTTLYGWTSDEKGIRLLGEEVLPNLR